MAEPKIFILTTRALSESYSDRVIRHVIPQHRNSVVILEEEYFAKSNVRLAAKAIADAIDDSGADENSYFLINDETLSDHDKLRNRWIESGKNADLLYINSQYRLIKRLGVAFIQLGFDWRTYANEQLNRFNGQTTPLEQWLAQFSDLKVGYVGRRLCMQLKVIGFDDNNRPFAPRAHEFLGQKVKHCYFNDGDPGGSWISIQDQLQHDLSAESVECIHVASDSIELPTEQLDEIVIYEDGLWSGSEAVKRLQLIKRSGQAYPIRFKYAVVTDFGLMVARHAIRQLGLQGLVRIDAESSKLERFLSQPIPAELEYGAAMDLDNYFKELHRHVDSGAFRNPNDWPEGFDHARQAVGDIGAQLVRLWCRPGMSATEVEARVEKFALGGGGFGSTMLFKRSVPKTCLPIFWLAGEVTLNGVTIIWKPLFLDARRVDHRLLHIA